MLKSLQCFQWWATCNTPAVTLVVIPFSYVLNSIGVLAGAQAMKFIILPFSSGIVPFSNVLASIRVLDGVDSTHCMLLLVAAFLG